MSESLWKVLHSCMERAQITAKKTGFFFRPHISNPSGVFPAQDYLFSFYFIIKVYSTTSPQRRLRIPEVEIAYGIQQFGISSVQS